MSLIAGIISRKSDLAPPTAVCESLRRNISREVRDKPVVFKDARSYFVKVDIGAFGEPAERVDENGSLTLLTGEPLLDNNSSAEWQSRERDTAVIHEAIVCDDHPSVLRAANGVFSVIHYRPDTGKLLLAADKLGLRPLYFWINDGFAIFASALRILEGLELITKRMDVQAVTEIVGLGYALGERTPYTDIALLRAGEVVTITANDVVRQKYWRWDEIELTNLAEDEVLPELYRSFNSAVGKRLRGDGATAAYLSGGLDSRCIVAALRDKGAQVHTFNFARPNT